MSEEEKLAFLLMVFYLLEQRRQATIQRLISYALALINRHTFEQGWRQEFSDGWADSSDEVAKIWRSGYYKCQKSPKNRLSSSDGG